MIFIENLCGVAIALVKNDLWLGIGVIFIANHLNFVSKFCYNGNFRFDRIYTIHYLIYARFDLRFT